MRSLKSISPMNIGDKIKSLMAFIKQRRKLSLFVMIVGGSLGIIPIMALGGNQLIQVVDSSAFCISCHSVHDAEAVTYEASPHNKVSCATCHVGDGVDNLVMSKLRGLKDIIPTFTGSYEHPIQTPLQNRRPSNETCETCHWAQKYFGDIPRIKTSYATDEANTENITTLVLKVDGGSAAVANGIHWHSTGKVWYLALDDQRLQMAWIATENSTGGISQYIDPNRIGQVTPELIQKQKRLMDCVDCHNRVTHLFNSPNDLIDKALTDGSIDIGLPYIKARAMEALVPQNPSLEKAYTRIETIRDFYINSYPNIFRDKKAAINSAITKLDEIARLTTFPDGLNWNTHTNQSVHVQPDANMQVDWATLALNDNTAGCFRCHGNLVKADDPSNPGLDTVLNGLNLNALRTSAELTLAATANNTIDGDDITRSTNVTYKAVDISVKNTNIIASILEPFGSNITADNRTGSNRVIVTDTAPHDGRLNDNCNLCHTSSKGLLVSPLAPATPHPIDGLDDCLVCHSPSAARPFKTDHPWATNAACTSCHKAAPKLNPIPVSNLPKEAKLIPHNTKGLEDCLVCHGARSTNPLKKDHPWATNSTCKSCHGTALELKLIPLSTPPVAPDIAHETKGFVDCLSCHGQPTLMPFTTNHPWGTNGNCSTCHKESTTPLQSAQIDSFKSGPNISHPITGMGECIACHSPKPTHPWTSTSACVKCHQPKSVGGGGAGGGGGGAFANQSSQLVLGPNILHSINGLETCIACHYVGGPMLFPVNHDGRPNNMCLICHQTAPPIAIPVPPVAVAAIPASAGQVNLTWVDSSIDETGFRIERATTPDFLTDLITFNIAANSVSYTDTTTFGSTIYYYRVLAYNSAGTSLVSDVVSVATPVSTETIPAGPTVLTANSVSASQIDLSWTDNSENESGFRIDRATSSNFLTNLVSVIAAINAISYSDSTVSSNTTYYYRVYAFNSAGNSAASNTDSATTPIATVDPIALYSVDCALCHGSNRQGASASAVTPVALSNVTLAQITSTINNGIGTMLAYSTRLSSVQIAALAQWLKGYPPVAPSNLSASAISAGQVNLFWLDNSNDETGFRVERAISNDFATNLFKSTIAANSVSYSDMTTVGSTTYYYRVYAYNPSGDSTASDNVSVTTPVSTATPPAAPTVLAATAVSAVQVNLSWLDNAGTETGYRIDRSTASNFSANLVAVNIAADMTSYSDTTVSGNSTYYFRVYAFNSAGNSAASNTASATTPVAPIDPSALYTTNCAVCHGASRQGGSASALTQSALSAVSLAQVTAYINNGIGTMPAYSSSMSPAQIAAIALWLKGPPPAAPSSLTATPVSAGQVNLAWVDNTGNETGERLERATTSDFLTNLVTTLLAANITSYNDMTTAGVTTYYYRVYAYNSTGDSTASNTANVTTPAPLVSVPAAPTSLTANATGAGQINLSWLDNAGTETGYRIDRSTASNFSANLVAVNIAADMTSYSDTTVSGNSTYYFRVYAFNSAGNSAASNTASATTPVAPIDPSALYTTNCAVCHGASRQGGSASALTQSALSAVSLAQVTAYINNGIGTMPAYSSSMSPAQIAAIALWLKGPPPAAPSSLTATPVSAGQVNLAWVDNTGNETGERLERATTSDFLTNLVTTLLAANITSYNDMTTAGVTTYYYRVYAYNSTGDSTASNTANVTTPAPLVSVPAAPTSLTANATGAGQINLSWLDNAGTETGYRIDRSTASNFSANLVAVNIAADMTSYSDTTVSGNSTYYFRVYAFNSAGNSAASNTASATTPVAPIDPSALYTANCAVCHGASRQGGSASALTQSALSAVSLAQVTAYINNGIGTMPAYSSSMSPAQIAAIALWLKGPPPAAPSSLTATPVSAGQVNLAWVDNTGNETGERLERATTSDFLTNLVTTLLAANITSYNDMTTAGVTTYYYRVYAYNSTGDSTASNTANVTTPAPLVSVPAAPTSLTANATGAGQINLSWLDNAGTETGYRIDRSTASNFSANLVAVNIAADMTSYSDTTVSGNSTYYFRVYAFNSAGNSAASNTASATTPVAPIDPSALYTTNCAVCHGASRQGGSASALTQSALSAVSLAQVTAYINNGIGTMPAYSSSMSPAQIAAIALWLKGPPPAAPSSLTATPVSAGQVNLAWVDNTGNETGERLERATTSDFLTNLVTTLLAANITSYNDMTTAGVTTYYYRVYAYNSTGDSTASNTANVTTPAPLVSVPAAPTSLTANATGAGQINLSWLDNAGTETGYRIDRSTASNFSANLVAVNIAADMTSYSDTTVSGNSTYYFRVYAFNSAGNSAASNTASATTPVAPIDPSALYTANCAVCHGASRQGGSASALTQSALSAVSLAQVTAYINNGIGTMPAYSSSMSPAQIAAIALWLKGPPPAAPSSLTATPVSAGQVNLAWVDNTGNETGERLERATTSDFLTNLVTTLLAANITSYNDMTTAGVTTYYYRVYAYNSTGDSTASNTANVTTPAPLVSVPAAPTSLTANATGAGQINLSWLDNAGTETGYRIDRSTASNFSANLVAVNIAADTTSYSDTTVSGNSTYYFRVYAFNSAGNSAASNTASATTPVAPIDPSALYTANCAVCHGASRQGGSASALTQSALSAVSLAQVTAYINNGIGTMPAYSSSMSPAQIAAIALWLKGPPPAAPSSLTATPVSAGQVNLAWVDNTGNETGERLERATTSDFLTNLVTTLLAANITSYNDMTTAGVTTYYYRVYAYNSTGDSTASNTANVTTPAPLVSVPAAPTSLTANATGAGQINLSWLDNAGTETGYRIDRSTASNFSANLVAVNIAADTTSYSDTTVSGNSTYYFRVYAFNSAGNSAASNTASATTPVAPIDPSALYTANCAVCHGASRQGGSASALTQSALSAVSLAQVTAYINNGIGTMPAYSSSMSPAQIAAIALWLKGPPPAAPSSLTATPVSAGQVNLAWVDNTGNETGERLERATTSDFLTNLVTTLLAANITSYNDMTTAGVTTYYYRVYAYNSTGDSTASNTANVTTPAATGSPPAAPTSLTAISISATQVNLSWLDNAGTETGYRIDRSTVSNFGVNLVAVNIAVNMTSYSDNTTIGSTIYYYRVVAFNAAGNSAASNTATVTTQAPSAAQNYSAFCASCHGAGGQGSSAPAIAGAAAPTTSFIVRGGGTTMPGYTTTQINATALTSLTTYVTGLGTVPTAGVAQYSLNCAVCHGSTGQGTTIAPYLAGVPVSTLSSITRSGLGTIMPAYATTDISAPTLTALANYILAMGPAPSDGWGVYAEYCAVCHGTGGRGGSGGNIAGASASTTTTAVRNGTGSMPAFTTTQISATGMTNLAAYVTGLSLARPTGLSATVVSSSQVNLTWTSTATSATGMRLQRATNSTFTANLVTFNLGKVTSYSDTTVSGATVYYYRVYATTVVGTSSASTTATVTTP